MQPYLKHQKIPLLIPSAGFDAKLSITDKNVDHTQAFISSGVKDFSLPGFVTPHRLFVISTERLH
ncbi:hypothetical protein [Candidatus Pantoea multigeneris]|uniref:hypothetical protein n=1 Tax=Candidatus Pantoea multigeneris TaxID=2608357 RepID=UPI001421818E|nr:hypothetical protein [Pantoea multigeneris]